MGKRLIKYVPDYTLFDIETTGLDTSVDRIVEISAARVRDGEVIDTFSTLVNPEMHVPSDAAGINGISDDMVADSPEFRDIAQRFCEFAGDDILAGHNIHRFDLPLVNRMLSECGLSLCNDYVDTLTLARCCIGDADSYSLTALAMRWKISTEGAHRAMNDVLMNRKVFEKLGRIIEEGNFQFCPVCGNILKKRKGRYGEFYGCSTFPECRYTRNV